MVEKQSSTNSKLRCFIRISSKPQMAKFLLIFPLRNATGCPRSTGGFKLFLESREIDFDQLSQLVQRGPEVSGRSIVLSDLSLRRTRDRHALRPLTSGPRWTSCD